MSKYVDFKGRASRSEYWWFILFGFIASFGATFFGVLMLQTEILGALVQIGLILPTIAVGVRRLHDIGRTGAWFLLALIPFVGILLLVIWFVQPSEDKANQFGEVPAA